MKPTDKNYVPILKWKRAEQGALFDLGDKYKDATLPFIELVMPKPKSSLKEASWEELYSEVIEIFRSKRLLEIPEEIQSIWGRRYIFVDFSLLYPDVKQGALDYVLAEASKLGLNIIPVVSLGDERLFKASIIGAHTKLGMDVCIRLSVNDLEKVDELNAKLANYLALPGIGEDCTHLLIDLKEVDEKSEYRKFVKNAQNISGLEKWKGLIVSCGSFPADLSECKFNEDNFCPRRDWSNWNEERSQGELKRIPTFSDYGIRHPIYNESYQFQETTASVKYTLDESWWIVKGKKRKYEQFLAAAALIFGDDERYFGENFSSGDQYLKEKALHFPVYMQDPSVKGTGTTELWLKAGTSHHLSVVSDRLSSLA